MKKITIFTASLILLSPIITFANFEQYPDLEYKTTNSNVSELQKFLNSNGYIVNQTLGEEGSIGHESDYFGELTRKALSSFQKDNNIEPSQGYFGYKTKNKIGSLVRMSTTPSDGLSSSDTEFLDKETTKGLGISAPQVEVNEKNILKTTSSTSELRSAAWGSPYVPVKWTIFRENKVESTGTYTYPQYTQITWTLMSDDSWDEWANNGFYLGASVNGGLLQKVQILWNLNLNGPTEINTYYQNCAELSPSHVVFSNVSELERKLMQFAQNKGDSKLKINAQGEVFAFAVQYGNDLVCAKLIDMTSGETVPINVVKSFYEAYKEKDIKKMYMYHSHDFKSIRDGSKDENIKKYLIYKNGNYYSPIPSDADIFGSFFIKENAYHKILGLGDVIERAVSADGTVYEYDQSASKKARDTWNDKNKYIKFIKKSFEIASQAADNSKKADKRKEYANKDALAAQQALLNFYNKELGATFSTYTVK